MATNHIESFALNIILGRRLEKGSERFVTDRKTIEKVNDNFKCHSESEPIRTKIILVPPAYRFYICEIR